jgi:hypothetical protein
MQPSPSIGFAKQERPSFIDRVQKFQPDALLWAPLIHHRLLECKILDMSLFASLSPFLITESATAGNSIYRQTWCSSFIWRLWNIHHERILSETGKSRNPSHLILNAPKMKDRLLKYHSDQSSFMVDRDRNTWICTLYLYTNNFTLLIWYQLMGFILLCSLHCSWNFNRLKDLSPGAPKRKTILSYLFINSQ